VDGVLVSKNVCIIHIEYNWSAVFAANVLMDVMSIFI
jgi:hypothetical protein